MPLKSQYVLFSLPQPALLTHSHTQFHPHLQNLMVDTNNASPNTSSRRWATSLIKRRAGMYFSLSLNQRHSHPLTHTPLIPTCTHTHLHVHPVVRTPSCTHPQLYAPPVVRTPSCTHLQLYTPPVVHTPTHLYAHPLIIFPFLI
jgi:hypothetical protein